LIEACTGLEVAHRQGIIHRDIKSSNLIITEDNHLKVIDFGLAKQGIMGDSATLTADISVQGVILGTIDYMSPEQACDQVVDYRSDLF
jgi:serine/threonine protein kinase